MTLFLIPVVAIISVFTFIAVATWSENRRKERETYYRHETYRKMMEGSGEGSAAVLDLMRQEELLQAKKRIDGLRLGGMITAVVGIGVMIFLYFLVPEEALYLAGLIPLLIGVVLAIWGFTVSPEPPKLGPPNEGSEGRRRG